MRVVAVLLVIGGAVAFVASGVAAEHAVVSGQVVTRGSGYACVRASCWQPLSAVQVTFHRNERVVARALSGRDGRFRVELAPGSYVMRAPGLVVLSRDLSLGTGSQRISLRPGQTLRPTLVVRRGAGKLPGWSLER